MLPTLHHGVGMNQSRLDYQSIGNDARNSNINNMSNLDTSESRLNKSRLLDYGQPSNYSNEHLLQQPANSKAQNNKYASDYSHLPHIRQND